MMGMRSVFVVGVALLLTVAAMAWGQEIIPPNDTGYSAQELSVLLPAIDKLDKILNDYTLGSGHYFSSDEWNSLDFAAYTAGVLSRLGYKTKIVSATGWPDGTHAWVLIAIQLPDRTAWLPIEASPAQGKRQGRLGIIPRYTDESGKMWFDSRYIDFDKEVVLPGNVPPVAQIRAVPTDAVTGRKVRFLGVTSYDPDGEVLFYSWNFSDGETAEGRSVEHAFTEPGTYTVVLTVTDSRGAVASTSREFLVREPGKFTPPTGGGGCPCHNH